ncbi:MAG: aminotransferase class III-fold pyridoxal phosphate-dependent enzyme, partial [Actinomadura sp.]
FRTVPYGDAAALRAAMDGSTVGVLIEPIQGEAGVVVPPPGFLREVRDLCTANGTLMIADEIQTGLGRTGATFACDHEDVVPDVYILGKALGGGIMPVSAVVADADVLGVFRPGQHGSTFGGNPLACAIAREVVAMIKTGEYQERSRRLGAHLHRRLAELPGDLVREVRGRGLWAGVELHGKARPVSERLMDLGVLAKETHETTLRLAPPLIIEKTDLDWALDQLEAALKS